MLPVLINIGFFKIYTFGLFLVLAFFWGTFLLWRLIRLTSYKEEDIFDGLFFSLFGAIFSARLVYVILNFDKFGFNILRFVLINGYPGLSLYGGLLGGFLCLYLFTFLKKIKFGEVIDYFISPIFLALAFGKIGGFFSGSEVGSKTKFILSIKYTGYDGLRHLTGFYEAILFVIGVFITYKILFEIRKEKYSKGFNMLFFIWFLSLIYFVFDKLKVNQLYLVGQSFNAMISFAILLTISIYFIYYFRSNLKSYGKATYEKINKGLGGKFTRRNQKNSKANRGTEKK